MQPETRSLAVGTVYAFLSFLFWGVLPFYWKWLDTVAAIELIAHRILWTAALMTAIVLLFQRRHLMTALKDPRALGLAALSGIMVGGNWFLYVWSVVSGKIVQASLGYYINPLVSVLLGVVILRERLTRAQLVALILAAVGVGVLTVSYGKVPWISLGLAFSFGLYGLIKKTGRLNPAVGLMAEMISILPAAVVILIVQHTRGAGAFSAGDPLVTVLLVATGIITAGPLLLFGAGARRIPLTRVGFLQYIAPTLMLLIGTVVYDEPFTTAHAVSFGLIWTALAIYTVTLVGRRPHRARGGTDAIDV